MILFLKVRWYEVINNLDGEFFYLMVIMFLKVIICLYCERQDL